MGLRADTVAGGRIERRMRAEHRIRNGPGQEEIAVALRDEGRPDPGGQTAQRHGQPDDGHRPRHDAEDRVDQHPVQQIQPIVPVREGSEDDAPEGARGAWALPDRTRDRRPPCPLQAGELDDAESACGVEGGDDDEEADVDDDGADTRPEQRHEHRQADDRDRHGQEEEAELAGNPAPEGAVAGAAGGGCGSGHSIQRGRERAARNLRP